MFVVFWGEKEEMEEKRRKVGIGSRSQVTLEKKEAVFPLVGRR